MAPMDWTVSGLKQIGCRINVEHYMRALRRSSNRISLVLKTISLDHTALIEGGHVEHCLQPSLQRSRLNMSEIFRLLNQRKSCMFQFSRATLNLID